MQSFLNGGFLLPDFYRTGGKNEKKEIASLGIAFGRLGLRRMRNGSRYGGRYTEARESGEKDGFRIGRYSECSR
jgi:hypothetical protein